MDPVSIFPIFVSPPPSATGGAANIDIVAGPGAMSVVPGGAGLAVVVAPPNILVGG